MVAVDEEAQETRPTVEEILSTETLSSDAIGGESSISSAKPGEGSIMSIIITVIVQTGAHTWQVDLGPELSRTPSQFRSVFYAIAAIPISEFNGSRFD